MALLSLAACGSGSSDNTLLTGTAGPTNPVTQPGLFPAPAGGLQDGTATEMSDRELAFASEIFRLVNVFRADNALPVVTWRADLAGVAMAHSIDQQGTGVLSHDGPAPCALPLDCLGQRLQTAGILYTTAGENLARGQYDPAILMQAWEQSPAHLDILSDPDWTQAGVGFQEGTSPLNAAATGPWVTLNFIRP